MTDNNITEIGKEMHELMRELYPICRSITGDGVRQTLNILKKIIPLDIHEVASGIKVFDWTVPMEWNIKDAYVKNSKGEKIIDFKNSNLHVLNYSLPVYKKVSLEELNEHLFTLPEQPDWIPYRTSYYSENWGFCISHNQFEKLEQDIYEVCIDSSLENGHLTYGEYFIDGQISAEVLISCHICHPSLCNDNLSGIALTTFLAKHLSKLSMHYSYRFIFIPGTIGSITWLSVNENRLSNVKHGLVAACVGDSGKFNYKRSRQGNAEIDRAVLNALRHSGLEFNVIDFFPFGYDERQYCSPGINLPVGCLMRTPHGEYPEYHTSADNLKFVAPECLEESLNIFLSIINILENNETYLNLNPKCEPQLGKRGLYDAIGGTSDSREKQLTMLWVLNLSDGKHSILDISEKSNIEISLIKKIVDILLKHNLLKLKT
jgi:aminopeptidase-like protein